jgi:hypothetical protein
VVASCIGEGCQRDDFRVVHFSVQSNHLHLIAEARDAIALARGIQGLSIRFPMPWICSPRTGTGSWSRSRTPGCCESGGRSVCQADDSKRHAFADLARSAREWGSSL